MSDKDYTCMAPATVGALVKCMETMHDDTAWAMETAFKGYEAEIEHWRERALRAEAVVNRLDRMQAALAMYDFDHRGQHR